jgi:glutamate-1-semialdehyde 2,1-aminomutase
MAERSIDKTSALFAKAQNYLAGGVSSPARAFSYVGGDPLLIARGRGSKAYDYDGNEYIDYCLSWGSAILGHAPAKIIHDLDSAVSGGLSFGTTNIKEIELAQLIIDAIPCIEKIRFVNSGTEAVMGAVRLARGYTDRDRVVKFEGSYHGHADYLLVSGGSGLATLKIPQSRGVPEDFIKYTIVVPCGNKEILDETFKKYGREIAAVLIEPAGGNNGVIPPDIGFLRHLRKITKRYGSLLIADEVITGFRFDFGSLALKFGIKPDLICLGKIIGGGLPVGAYGGSGKIMAHLAPLGKVYQASTFSGNPVVMQAGISTLRILAKSKNDYGRLDNLANILANTIEKYARAEGIGLAISRFGSMFSFKFEEKKKFETFYRGMLDRGVYFVPSEYEANFLSFAHTKKDIDKTIAPAKSVLASI